MRCSSCEPLLDDYLEAALVRPQMRAVAQHVESCGECGTLLRELRVVDALLETARPPAGVGANFTASVVSATRESQPHPVRRTRLWLALLAYLAVAWALLGLAATRAGMIWGPLTAFAASGQAGLSAIGAALREFAPASAIVAAAFTAILLLDALLVCALAVGYRRLRP